MNGDLWYWLFGIGFCALIIVALVTQDRRVQSEERIKCAEIAANERIAKDRIALDDRKSQHEAENFKQKTTEENKTKQCIATAENQTSRFIAATVVAVAGLATVVFLGGHFRVENPMIYRCVFAIIACVVLGAEWKLLWKKSLFSDMLLF